MLTQEQETFLAALADKLIAEASAEQARIAEEEATRAKNAARAEFIAALEAEQLLAKEQAIADFDAGKIDVTPAPLSAS